MIHKMLEETRYVYTILAPFLAGETDHSEVVVNIV